MLNICEYVCVGMDSMEGLSGRVHCSYEEEGGWLSPSKDELDIVGKLGMDDNVEEEHVGTPSPSVQVYHIVKCYRT